MNKFFLLILILILPLSQVLGQKFDPLEGKRRIENKRKKIRQKTERRNKNLYRPIKRIEKKEEKKYQAYLKANREKHLKNQDLKTRMRIESNLKETQNYYKKENLVLFINRIKRIVHGNR